MSPKANAESEKSLLERLAHVFTSESAGFRLPRHARREGGHRCLDLGFLKDPDQKIGMRVAGAMVSLRCGVSGHRGPVEQSKPLRFIQRPLPARRPIAFHRLRRSATRRVFASTTSAISSNAPMISSVSTHLEN